MDFAIPDGAAARRLLDEAISQKKIVVLTGIPGVGKSLLVQQATLVAGKRDRKVHLVQWDVVRASFESPEILTRYPEVDGVTHPAIVVAAGSWIRRGIAEWAERHAETSDILIVEAPVEKARLVEVVIKQSDAAEPILAGEMSTFLLPVPTLDVRREIESRRARELASPSHDRERGNAPMARLFDAMQSIYQAGRHFGVAGPEPPEGYDPELYEAVFQHLLRDRPMKIVPIDSVWNVEGSAYDLAGGHQELTPTPTDVERIYTESIFATSEEELNRRVSDWFDW